MRHPKLVLTLAVSAVASFANAAVISDGTTLSGLTKLTNPTNSILSTDGSAHRDSP